MPTTRPQGATTPEYLAHLGRVSALEPAPAWDGSTLPSLYLSHGAPPLLQDEGWMTELHTWARSLPRPRAVLVVSAHWESAPLSLSAVAPRGLVYDFGGFDPLFWRMQYATPDATWLAQQVTGLVPGVHQHPTRGLDHGAWVPLMAMYPEADVPVLQLSIPTHDSTRLLELGRRLRPLREQGVLVVGSGFMTHGLPYVDWQRPHLVPGWSADFDAWAAEALARGDVEELAAFRTRAPGMPYAHPTVEHFTPLLLALGAADDPEAAVRTAVEGWFLGLSKRSFAA